MKRLFLLTLIILMTLSVAFAQTDNNGGLKRVYDESIEPIEQIDNALVKAKEEGKFVVCQVGGNWCPWCLRFAHFISNDEDIAKIIDDNYIYIHVNYNPKEKDSAKKEANKILMKRLSNAGRFGYPVLVVLSGSGEVIHIQDSSFLEEGDGYNKKRVYRFFKQWIPSAVNQ